MTTRNFDALFDPKTIALVGASNEQGSVGAVLARNLFSGGFAGAIWPVNPRASMIQEARNYRSIAELPGVPDLAVIATPRQTVPDLIAELGARGCRAAVVISAGFGEGGRAQGLELRQQLLDAAKPHLMRILGPNSLGFLSPRKGINASFAHIFPKAGEIAFITQSGAIATSIIDWAQGRNIGFSHILSLGDMSDVDFGDLLDYLALDERTRAILVYIESVTHARKFMSAGRIAARAKPVIVIKSGRGEAGARAATSHSGALAGSDAVYEAAFRRAGMLRVTEVRELFDAAETLASGLKVYGDRLMILTNGGGLGVLASDALEDQGGRLASLSAEARGALDKVLPAAWSHDNPVDILGDASGRRYQDALEILLREPDQDAILVMNCPTGVADNREAADAVLEARTRHTSKPMLACWMGAVTASVPRQLLSAQKLPNYETPDEAVRAFMHLVNYRRNQDALLETPEAGRERPAPSVEPVREMITAVLAEGRAVMTEPEAKRVLAACGIATVETLIATSAQEAAAQARKISGPVALKILSREITHKSDAGGVMLNLETPQEVESAAARILERVASLQPKARIDGFTVQPMIVRPKAYELIAGMIEDSVFGPAILFGQGGTAVEVIRDRAMALPPLNSVLARDLISRTRIAKLLGGYRDVAPANLHEIGEVLIALSDLVIDHPEIAELDINPLLADRHGVIALDARIVVRKAIDRVAPRLAIRPYPRELAHEAAILDGTRIPIRPIRPEDERAIVEMGRRTKPEDLRFRFHGAMREISHTIAGRLSQIDYDREMAFAALDPSEPAAIVSVGRLVFDPNFEAAEFAIMVRSDWQGRGLGRIIMGDLIAYAKSRGATRLWGDVLAENSNMLGMAHEMGARLNRLPHSGVVRAEFWLMPP